MATTQVETVSTRVDKLRLVVAVALVIASLVGFYVFSKQGALTQWGVLIVGFAVAIVVFLTSESGKQFIAFGKDSVREVRKVVWPERKEAIQMTMYVFAFVVVMSIFLWLTDKSLEWIFYDLLLGWR